MTASAARHRLFAAIAIIVVAFYCASVTVEVAPDSALVGRLRKITDGYLHPYFSQRWNLFAPDVPKQNFTTMMQVRFRDQEAIRTSAPVDLTATLDALVKKSPYAPPRIRRITTALEIQAANLARYEARLDAAQARHPGKPLPGVLERDIAKRRETLREAYRRYLSSLAPTSIPAGAEALAVRSIVTVQGIPRLGRGADASNPALRESRLYDSGWLQHAEGVTSL